jgi:HEAT repeat protein
MKPVGYSLVALLVVLLLGTYAYHFYIEHKINTPHEPAMANDAMPIDPASIDTSSNQFAPLEAAAKPIHEPGEISTPPILAEELTDEEIGALVERLFVAELDDGRLELLQRTGLRAVPFLVKALDDSRIAKRFDTESIDRDAPLTRVCRLIEPFDSAVVRKTLSQYLHHQDEIIRQYATETLASIGTAECIGPIVKALNDDDDSIRSFAMEGIRFGLEEDKCTDEFLQAIFPAISKLLNRSSIVGMGEAPALLLAIDEQRALPVLLSPEYFTPENDELFRIIEALNQIGHKIPHDLLQPLLNKLKPLASESPHDFAYAEALRAYASHPDSQTEEVMKEALLSSRERVQTSAAVGLSALAGVADARTTVYMALDQVGFDRLSAFQKHYLAVSIYDAEVRNGGHSQYFVNPSGDLWKFALEGLKAIGATERAQLLEEAVQLFGRSGPSVDNNQRLDQLSAAKIDKRLSALDERYYASKENTDALLAMYTIKHKDQFIRASLKNDAGQ